MLQGKKKSNGSSFLVLFCFFPVQAEEVFRLVTFSVSPRGWAHRFINTLKKTNSLKWLLSLAEPGQRERINSNYPLKLPLNLEFLFSQYTLRGRNILKDHKREHSSLFVTVHLQHQIVLSAHLSKSAETQYSTPGKLLFTYLKCKWVSACLAFFCIYYIQDIFLDIHSWQRRKTASHASSFSCLLY